MGTPAIKWTPTGGTERTATFPRGLSLFDGYRDVDATRTVTRGGAHVAIFHDAYSSYEVELRGYSAAVNTTFFEAISSWWAWAAAGGEFKFYMDSDNALSTTLSAATTGHQTTCTVNSTSSLATGDIVFVEDASDFSKFELRSVTGISAATVTFNSALGFAYESGSTLRHAEYFPACVVLDTTVPFRERPAGQGNRVYDLRFRFRTVR